MDEHDAEGLAPLSGASASDSELLPGSSGAAGAAPPSPFASEGDPPPDPATGPTGESAVPVGAAPRRVRMAAIEDAGTLPDGCLLVDEYGSFLGKHGERLRILVKGE